MPELCQVLLRMEGALILGVVVARVVGVLHNNNNRIVMDGLS